MEKNNFKGNIFQDGSLKNILSIHEECSKILKEFLDQKGITIDINAWKEKSWYHRLSDALNDIREIIAEVPITINIDATTKISNSPFLSGMLPKKLKIFLRLSGKG